jgi:CRP/FNR family transcriptional regulator
VCNTRTRGSDVKGRKVPCCADNIERVIDELRTRPPFAALPRDVIRTLLRSGRGQSYRGGEQLQGATWENQIGVVVEGSVRIYLASPDGRTLALLELSSGELFELEAGLERAGDPATAIVEAGKRGCAVYLFDHALFLRSVSSTSDGAFVLATLLLGRLHDQRRAIAELAFSSMRTRVARTLGRLAATNAEHIVCETHQELAARLGTGREEVTRAVTELRKDNLVTSPGRGQTLVPEPEKLIGEHIFQH